MRKIPTIFKRDPENMSRVLHEINPECAWVFAGEGMPTRKFDGTCCLIRERKLYKRFELKPGKNQPPDFEPAQEPDPNTGKQPGWLPVGDGAEDCWHREALRLCNYPVDGTYELCGPKLQGNPEGFKEHRLMLHGACHYDDIERTFEGIRAFLAPRDIEGIVFHHPDGRMAKIKKRDFGLSR